MRQERPLIVRSCPICRMAMVRTDAGWYCPQCGSAIIGSQPAKAVEPQREDALQ